MRLRPAPALAPFLAEGLGTFALVFAGPGAVAVNAASGGAVTGVGIGMSFGLIVMAMIFALGHVSGCHINPAVTIAMRALGRIGSRRAAGYVAAQLAGAVIAGFAIVAIVGSDGDAGASAPHLGGTDAALWSEIILTFLLMFVILSVATDSRAQGSFAAIAIGGYVGFAATGWGPVANASMNPARSFGPAVAAGAWDAHWVYWAGPIAGALLAAAAYELMREPHYREPPALPDATEVGP
ncbi:MAG: aquaporin [Dehalococcoidia bacterium]|nr:aquaporin [Dehalococcoidia bacterium]